MASSKPLLNEERTWEGYWWHPGDQETAMPGTLTYHPQEGLTLRLIGGWDSAMYKEVEPGVFHGLDESKEWSLLHGLAENQEITLLDCLATSTRTWGVGPVGQQTIQAQTALVGVHLDEPEQKLFTKCHVSVEDLTFWSQTSILRSSEKRSPEDWKPVGASIEAELLEDPSVRVNGVETSLRHVSSSPYEERSRERTIKRMWESRYISFQPDEPWALSTALEHEKMVQDLLSLALHRPCAVLWLQLRMPPEESELSRRFDLALPEQTIDVYYSRPLVVAEPSAEAIRPDKALFTCEHLPFEQVWPRWYEVREQYFRASNLILGLRYAPPKFLELRLLTVTSAAEVLHRALEETQPSSLQPPIPPEEFKNLRKGLLENTPDEHHDWVKNSLRNQVTLRQRLTHLVTLPDSTAMERLITNVEDWAGVTTKARNSLTHEGHAEKQSIDELIAAVNVTSAVVVMNLLQALGVSNERQQDVITEHPEFYNTAKQAKRVFPSGTADE